MKTDMYWRGIFKIRGLLLSLILLISQTPGFSQEKYWQAGMSSFFDNVEFGGSTVKVPQTMSGVWFNPGIGFKWDSLHRVVGGIDMLHEFGSNKVIDKISPVAYYEMRKGRVRFLMGAFPRSRTINYYPRLFFQDSVYYYRPNVNGVFFETGNSRDYINVWLDWTGRQSATVREAFFAGIGGRYSFDNFYLRHNGFMYHFASTSDPDYDDALHDNALFLTSFGTDLSGRSFLKTLDISAGWVAGFERARGENTGWINLNGFLLEIRAEYRCFGLFNSFYSGDRQFRFYEDHSNELYWGDPAYRAGTYNRSDFYVDFIRDRKINFRLTYSLHALNNKVYHEQMLRVNIDLEGIY